MALNTPQELWRDAASDRIGNNVGKKDWSDDPNYDEQYVNAFREG